MKNALDTLSKAAPRKRARPAARFLNITAKEFQASAKETPLHVSIFDLFMIAREPEALCFHVPNGEKRDARTGAKLKKMGTVAGVSDLVFIQPGYGRACFLEIKTDAGELSDAQKDFRFAAIKAGALYAVARSLDEAIAILSGWKIIRVSPNQI